MTRVYRFFLRLLPRSLRERYGDEMTELFTERLADLPASRLVRLRFLVRSLLDVLAQGGAERRSQRQQARQHQGRIGSSLLRAQVRVAMRQFYRAPLATGAIVVTLAVAVGATTGVFSVVSSVLFRALPYDEPESLVLINSVRTDRPDAPFTLPEFMDYRERARSVELAAYAQWSANLSLPDVTRRLQAIRISANGLDVLGMRAAAGRLFQPSDDEPTASKVAVIGHALWQNEFGTRADVIGQTIRLNAAPYTVVGVLPRHFPFPVVDVQVAVPLSPELDPWRHVRNSVNFLRFLGRLAPTATIESVEQELSTITRELRAEFPAEYAAKQRVDAIALQQAIVGETRAPLIVLLVAVLLMLCIGLANLMSVLLIRATTRKHELAVRRAIGASRGQLVAQLVTEGGVLAAIGGALGIALATWAVGAVVRGAPVSVPRLHEATVDGHALIFTAIVVVSATLLLSVAPLVVALRTPAQEALRAGARGRVGGWEQHTRHGLVVAEIALALVLLSATVLLAGSIWRLQRVEPGFDPAPVFTARVSLPRDSYDSQPVISLFYDRLRQRLATLPGVESAGVISIAPLSGLIATTPFTLASQPGPREEWGLAQFRAISPGYLDAAGTRLLRGRGFNEFDTDDAPTVVLISQALVDAHFPASDPIGQRLLIDDNNDAPREVEIAGVVENVRQTSLDGPPSADIYLPWKQVDASMVVWLANNQFWALRVSGEPETVQSAFLRELKAVEPDAAADRAGPMRDYLDAWLAPRRFNAALLFGFALAAVLLAATGVYAVMAYNIELRRREIGLRMALGATRGEIVRWLVLQALRLSLVGIGVGLAIAVLAGGSIAGLLFGVTPRDPRLLAAVAAALLALTTLGGCIAALRTARADPSVALAADT